MLYLGWIIQQKLNQPVDNMTWIRFRWMYSACNDNKITVTLLTFFNLILLLSFLVLCNCKKWNLHSTQRITYFSYMDIFGLSNVAYHFNQLWVSIRDVVTKLVLMLFF